MKLIEADHHRLYEIPGVPGPARKPVDIDETKTGFQRLRSLRIYSFEEGTTIDGHAEEDEVFVVVTSGSVKIKIGKDATDAPREHVLVAAIDGAGEPFAAYLPPHAVYQLTPLTAADVAYARATPHTVRSPAFFSAASADRSGVLLDERTHAEMLRLKVMRLQPNGSDAVIDVINPGEIDCEALLHIQGHPAEAVGHLQASTGAELPLKSWQTVALEAGERAMLRVADGADALVLTVLAA